jgi:hypothetical protein
MAIKKHLLLLLLVLQLNGCASLGLLGEVVGPAFSATGAYFSYKASKVEPINVTTVSRDCYLKTYIQVTCENRVELKQTKEGMALLQNIAKENKLFAEQCPDFEVPPKLDCSK